MEKVRPSCGQASDRGRIKNRTEYIGLQVSNAMDSISDLAVGLGYRPFRVATNYCMAMTTSMTMRPRSTTNSAHADTTPRWWHEAEKRGPKRTRLKVLRSRNTLDFRRIIIIRRTFQEYTGWVKKASCCTVIDISKARQQPKRQIFCNFVNGP